jgi:hypothetical protein
MIYEWKPSSEYRNYGDALGEIVAEALREGLMSERDILDNPEIMYFPIGSVVGDYYMEPIIEMGLTPVFIGCGWYGEEITPELAQQSQYIGCRGPGTKAALERAGVEGIPIYGDTAYIAFDYLKLTPTKSNQSILIPHILSDNYDLGKSGADKLVIPHIQTKEDTINMVDEIASADFVLSSAMHGCITAHAYGVPFALYSPGGGDVFPDKPKKWNDWFDSVGIDPQGVKVCSSIEEGMDWYEDSSLTT